MIFYLIYISEANDELSSGEIQKIVNESRINNQSKHITGMLLYLKNESSDFTKGRFIQLLEGSVEHVNGLYSVISQDPRHSKCLMLQKGFAEDRAFGDWTMGYKAIDDEVFAKQAGIFALEEHFLKDGEEHNFPRLSFLKSFYELGIKGL